MRCKDGLPSLVVPPTAVKTCGVALAAVGGIAISVTTMLCRGLNGAGVAPAALLALRVPGDGPCRGRARMAFACRPSTRAPVARCPAAAGLPAHHGCQLCQPARHLAGLSTDNPCCPGEWAGADLSVPTHRRAALGLA